ncbi:hypothetical protein EGW08_013013 [Elysia chlorotica]|uniref:Uncharacterized protein n=1 Tax=Elysia chlorotica TaxID=188477 RepID=A0A3S0ZHU4_ELYCH|nr:hypothetical protein EGW08_013013 [Elysia chlorotica]
MCKKRKRRGGGMGGGAGERIEEGARAGGEIGGRNKTSRRRRIGVVRSPIARERQTETITIAHLRVYGCFSPTKPKKYIKDCIQVLLLKRTTRIYGSPVFLYYSTITTTTTTAV